MCMYSCRNMYIHVRINVSYVGYVITVHVLVYVCYALDVGEGPWGMCSKMDSHPFLVDWHTFAFTTRQHHIRHRCMSCRVSIIIWRAVYMHACVRDVCIHCIHRGVHACVHACMNVSVYACVAWTNKFVTCVKLINLLTGHRIDEIYLAHMTKKQIWHTYVHVRYQNTLLETIHAHYFEYKHMHTYKQTYTDTWWSTR